MSTADWVLMLHVTAAFCLVGGSVAAATFNVLAIRSDRPSEAAFLLGLIQRALPFIFAGIAGTFIFGVWLWHEKGYGLGSGWIWGALVLWAAASGLGGAGGRSRETARALAEKLANAGDSATDEFRAALRDPRGNGLTALSLLATFGVLALMIWKPGA